MNTAEGGALYKLAHQKANALSAMRAIAQEVAFRLEKAGDDDEQLALILPILQERGKQMDEIDLLDKRMAFLEDSGYEPLPAEAARISLEKGTIQTLLQSIKTLDEQGIKALEKTRGRLMESIKEIKDGQRSIQAYAAPPEEEEPTQLDTLR